MLIQIGGGSKALYERHGTALGLGSFQSRLFERLKIAGACWHPETVNPMLALRVVRANGWWDTFWQWLHVQRAQQRAA